MTASFTDSGQTIEDFLETIYVRCPRCQKRAQVKRLPSDEEKILADESVQHGSSSFQRSFSSRKVSCLHCSYTRIWERKGQQRGDLEKSIQKGGGPCDRYFRLSLWLQTPCCGEILWAFNEEHLRFLEEYATAKQRIKFYVEGQVRNGTLASRLPIWIKSAKNRDEVIQGIGQLKALLEMP